MFNLPGQMVDVKYEILVLQAQTTNRMVRNIYLTILRRRRMGICKLCSLNMALKAVIEQSWALGSHPWVCKTPFGVYDTLCLKTHSAV